MGAVRKKELQSERCIRWIETYCRVPEGRLVGQPVKMREWQKKILRDIYDSPTRRAIISFPRKNGKTALSAFLLLLHLCGPKARPNSQLFSAAQSREQAGILFNLAAKTVRMSPDLNAVVAVRDTAKQLFCGELGTLYRALSAEASTSYGLSPVFVVHDELGQVRGPRSELYESLETAAGAQDEPLSIVISTQAPTDMDLLSVLIDDARTGKDPRVKLALFSADDTADPFDENTIKQANPAYGDFLNAVEVRDQAESARRMPAREAAYRNLVLNQRVNSSTPFISRSMWESCAGDVDANAFANPCWIGLDLSARNDLTALVMVACDDDGIWHVQPEFFVPEIGIVDRARRDRVPYDLWAKEGHLTATPGASIDLAYVAERLCQLADDYQIQGIAYDRWRIDVLQAELRRLGRELPMVPFGQGFRDMAPALDVIEHTILEGKMRHGGHPVLRMCAANAVVTRHLTGDRKLDKVKATGRIDGMVALAMALGMAARGSDENFDDFLSNVVSA